MKKFLLLVASVLLAGCTITMEDKRLTREEVAQALAQRDQVLANLAQEILTLKAKPEDKKK